MATQSFQARVIASITGRIEAAGFETSISHAWPNIGSIYAHREGEIAPVITVGFNFQSDAYTLTLTVGNNRVPSQVGRADYFDFYHNRVTDLTRFDECLASELKAVRRAGKRRA